MIQSLPNGQDALLFGYSTCIRYYSDLVVGVVVAGHLMLQLLPGFHDYSTLFCGLVYLKVHYNILILLSTWEIDGTQCTYSCGERI